MMQRNPFALLGLATFAAALVLSGPARAQDTGEAPVGGQTAVEDQPPEAFTWERRRPGQSPEDVAPPRDGRVPLPMPSQFPQDEIPIPDRWRLIEAVGVNERWWDPYNQNTLKGDRPVFGTQDIFVVLTAISDTVVEPRSFPIPVGVQTTDRPDSNDLFGDPKSLVFNQNLITSLVVVQGQTAFKPPDLEFRLTPVFNFNYVEVEERRILFVEPSRGITRRDGFIGMQELFLDYHIRNVSDRYDFDSIRVGIQPFSTDFRGFLFQDNQLGVRLFGNRDNNRWQYNLGAFLRVEKDTNSGLNDLTQTPREDYIFVANLYRQDFPVLGLTSQGTILYNLNREGDDLQIDENGFPVRPALIGTLRGRDYDAVYVGYNADGRIGRINLTASVYGVFGQDRDNIFTDRESEIRAFFAAVEPSYDLDWARFRLSGLFASGDSNPFNDTQTGFDAIFENPIFAGADTSYWMRQTIPLIGGGRAVVLNGRNALLPSLRSSKEEGQSNFINPGLILAGLGTDLDVTPEWRLSFNANHLWFHHTDSLEALRVQGDVGRDIGWDVSAAVIYRPGFIQNLVFRLSGAALLAGGGFKDLYRTESGTDTYYSVLFNAVLTY